MNKTTSMTLFLSALAVLVLSTIPSGASAAQLRVVAEHTVTGLAFPESVAYDPNAKVLYSSQFGSELKPTQKDGKGKIAKVSLTGQILEDQFLPAKGEILNKPKGIWVKGSNLWVTDIDVVWQFDLKTRQGKKVSLPEVQFANDPTVKGNALYVSDNRGDHLYRVEPADFLHSTTAPKVTIVFSGKSVNPNGLYPARDGSLLMVGFKSPEEPRGIYALEPNGTIKALSKPIGRLDGLYQMKDGTLIVTDWNSGSVFSWTAKGGMHTLASGFKGPADLCSFPHGKGLMVVVPDLVKSQLRMLELEM